MMQLHRIKDVHTLIFYISVRNIVTGTEET